jgi:hypothetical protein
LSEFERDGGHARCSAVFDGEDELVVAPGMELGGAAQGLAGADAAGAFLGVVDVILGRDRCLACDIACMTAQRPKRPRS